MFVKRKKDQHQRKVLMHRIADVRGGVSIAKSDIPSGAIVEGAIIAVAGGKYHILPTALCIEALGASAKSVKVAKFHNFAIGQTVTKDAGAVASKITAIDDSNKAYDVLTLSAAIGEVKVGESIVAAKAVTTSNDSVLLYEPFAVAGTSKDAEGDFVDVDAWLIGVTTNLQAPSSVINELKGIVNIAK